MSNESMIKLSFTNYYDDPEKGTVPYFSNITFTIEEARTLLNGLLENTGFTKYFKTDVDFNKSAEYKILSDYLKYINSENNYMIRQLLCNILGYFFDIVDQSWANSKNYTILSHTVNGAEYNGLTPEHRDQIRDAIENINVNYIQSCLRKEN
ncbi:hypothetical protein [Acinetobacter sp.]|uniref:hypothetical protein n=1 Tax=Acinetobacter sp. TaxID=472 RepID=UPI003D0590EF